MSRLDYTTSTPPIKFSDIPMNLDVNPLSNTLAVVTNDSSIKQSLKCLLLTSLGERLYDSTLGSDIKRQLFEQNDAFAINTIDFAIKNTIEYNEPRVSIVSLNITPSSDGNYMNISLEVTLINDPTPIYLSLLLRRVR